MWKIVDRKAPVFGIPGSEQTAHSLLLEGGVLSFTLQLTWCP